MSLLSPSEVAELDRACQLASRHVVQIVVDQPGYQITADGQGRVMVHINGGLTRTRRRDWINVCQNRAAGSLEIEEPNTVQGLMIHFTPLS